MGVTGVTGVMGEGCCGRGVGAGTGPVGRAKDWLSEGPGREREEMGSAEVSIVTSKATSRPHTWARARLMAGRLRSMILRAKANPTTSTRTPSTSMTRVMRSTLTLPGPSSPEAASSSRAASHFMVAWSGTAPS